MQSRVGNVSKLSFAKAGIQGGKLKLLDTGAPGMRQAQSPA